MSRFVHDDRLRWAILRYLTVLAVMVATIGLLVAFGPPCRLTAVRRALLWGLTLGLATPVATFTWLRRREWRRTFGMTLLAGAAGTYLALAFIPNLFGAIERARRVVAMADMRQIGRLLDEGRQAPTRIDPWGTPYRIVHRESGYTVISFGECSEPDFEPGVTYQEGVTSDPASDIVFSNGRFVRYPEGEQP